MQLIKFALASGNEVILGKITLYIFMHPDLKNYLKEHTGSGDYEDVAFKRFVGKISTSLNITALVKTAYKVD